MKKIILGIISILLLSGCGEDIFNTPIKKVETFFQNYQTLSEDVVEQLNKVVNEEENFNADQRLAYKELMKKHYQDLTYEIKDEIIDGDTATVTTEIEVTDYSKVMMDADTYKNEHSDEFTNDEGVYDASLFIDYRLKQLKDVKETVKYTIDFTLTKIDNEWKLDTLTEEQENKLHGLYNY